ncbi:ribosomal protein L11 methyltransferase [Paenibacillus jamilae]|jgi:ribosomal protein L11 methyltransferase|uniref:50S ribosomal protein L11 methyltransferase n=1 Tax=Paenibacillus TaxID=44249 RepID=UPI000D30C4B4|nr:MULTISPECIES: 50S ribosomal protein L11 methyltransferase [Paenibacillus]KAF6617261.1 50S ribosomal protein L11 methyltransferase [Paenibacillus sp. EKM101P]KAF6622063.1 50S ribosomal protein L11 methyltransferase [Paenibacillus sp. EKM102P]KAF6631386.1 50S ribosomal protein L11 methyltransferase [Paenibacillus sp. EKM10P]KAF6650087.1 50S ribosomal protein L11 methyltransferase [Paenibacillus sp. EKM11P]MBY0022614.1 50S ribosomal protein L11 methyltransferase [Paenibacillus polymyxa]
MLWNEITIHTSEEAVEMISNFLHEAGAGGVSIEESGSLNKPRDTSYGQWYDRPLNDIPEGQAIIKGYFAEEVDMDSVRAQIEPRVEQLRTFDIDPGEVRYELKTVNEDDWANAWKQYFKPLRVSDRLTIKPTWEEYEPASEDEKIIELDPGMAFGTGTHPTTSLCLRTLESVIQGGEEVIDVGTGSGILAIGAVKLGAKHVLALDLDPVAVSSARENTRLNGLEERITIKESDLLSVLNASDPTLGIQLPVKLVVANILAEIILLFIDDVYNALQPGGIYIASGIWKNKEEAVETALKAAGFEIAEINRDEDWLAFVARKR